MFSLFTLLFCLEDGVHLAFQLRIFILAIFFFLYLLSPLDLVPEVRYFFRHINKKGRAEDDNKCFAVTFIWLDLVSRSV